MIFRNRKEDMLTKTTLGFAVILPTASGALAARKTQNIAPIHDLYTVYNPANAYVGIDSDINIRFRLNRNWAQES
jgi:hypothetical protein